MTVRSEGFEDRKNGRMLAGRARAYIKVNNVEKSLGRRGINVVVISKKTGELRQRIKITFVWNTVFLSPCMLQLLNWSVIIRVLICFLRPQKNNLPVTETPNLLE